MTARNYFKVHSVTPEGRIRQTVYPFDDSDPALAQAAFGRASEAQAASGAPYLSIFRRLGAFPAVPVIGEFPRGEA